MFVQSVKALFLRDLNKLKTEVLAYTKEENLWIVDGEILNSGGNLCLHLIGNINTFICGELGNSGYIRKRTAEFGDKNVPREKLIADIETTIAKVNGTLDGLSQEEVEKDYPKIVFKEKMSTQFFLMHLAGHLTYHLGQLNYHRRLLDK